MKRNAACQTQAITMPFNLLRKPNIKIILFFIVLTVFPLFVFSIYQFISYTDKIYLKSSLEKRIEKIVDENKVLEINLAEASSLGHINNFVHNFEKAERIEYIRILEGTALAR